MGEKETGGRTALPFWTAFMREAGHDSDRQDFPIPEGIEWSAVNLNANGYPLPLFERSPEISIPFVSGTRIATVKVQAENEP